MTEKEKAKVLDLLMEHFGLVLEKKNETSGWLTVDCKSLVNDFTFEELDLIDSVFDQYDWERNRD